jgi:hypothetical protein
LIITVTILVLSISARIMLALLQAERGIRPMMPSSKPRSTEDARARRGDRRGARRRGAAKVEIRGSISITAPRRRCTTST